MRRILISLTVFALLFVPQFVSAGDVDDLKAAWAKAVQDWNSLNAESLIAMRYPGFVNFGYDAAFPEVEPMNITKAQKIEGMKMYLSTVESISINPYNLQYRVVGNTGITWGHYTLNIKLKGQPSWITQHARMTSTWVKSDGKWSIIMVHSSAIPSGD